MNPKQPKFQTVEIPFKVVGSSNRSVLTALQLVQEPWLKEFVDRFPACFAHHPYLDVMVYYPDGNAPK